jgi:hypothetical protein
MRRLMGQARPWAAVAVAVCGVLLLLVLAQTSPGGSVLETIGLREPPERYTELAFVRAEELPEELRAGASFALRFELHNHEGERRSYTWSAEELSAEAGTTTPLAAGEATLPPGGATMVERSVEVPCDADRVVIRLRLARPAQSIRFAVECQARAT